MMQAIEQHPLNKEPLKAAPFATIYDQLASARCGGRGQGVLDPDLAAETWMVALRSGLEESASTDAARVVNHLVVASVLGWGHFVDGSVDWATKQPTEKEERGH